MPQVTCSGNLFKVKKKYYWQCSWDFQAFVIAFPNQLTFCPNPDCQGKILSERLKERPVQLRKIIQFRVSNSYNWENLNAYD